jgi:hypothetical protein
MGEVIHVDFQERTRKEPLRKEEMKVDEKPIEIESSRKTGFRKKVLEIFLQNQKKIKIIKEWLEETKRNPSLQKCLQQELGRVQVKEDDVVFDCFKRFVEGDEVIEREDRSVDRIFFQALFLDLQRRIK